VFLEFFLNSKQITWRYYIEAIMCQNQTGFICLQLFHWHKFIGRAAGVSLTPGIHRAAVKRQIQSDRGRGGIRVLGNIGGQVGSRSIA